MSRPTLERQKAERERKQKIAKSPAPDVRIRDRKLELALKRSADLERRLADLERRIGRGRRVLPPRATADPRMRSGGPSSEDIWLAQLGSDGTVGGPGGDPISGEFAGFGLPACAVLAASNVTLSGLQTIDGHALGANERVLCVGQSTGSQNGPWLAHSGAWTRPDDYAATATLTGGRNVQILFGAVHGREPWILETSPVTVDTTATTWVSGTSPAVVSMASPATEPGQVPTWDGSAWEPGAGGASYTASMFGLKPDAGTTDNAPLWDAMLASLAFENSFANGTPKIEFAAGTYHYSRQIYGNRSVFIEGQAGNRYPATEFTFPDGCPGLVIDFKPGVSPTDAAHSGTGFRAEHLWLTAAGHTNPQAHGIVIRQTCTLRDVAAYNFGGDGVNLDSLISLNSNATDWLMDDVFSSTCANGFYISGGNAGAGLGLLLKADHARFWSLIDNSNVASTYVAPSSEFPAQGAHTNAIDRSSGGYSAGFSERTWLAKDVLVGDTSIAVLTGLGLPTAGRIYIDNETIDYTGISVAAGSGTLPMSGGGTSAITYDLLTGCTRGANSTSAAAHAQQPFGDSIITYIYWPQGMDIPLGANNDAAGNNLGPTLITPYTESDYSLNSRWRGKVFGLGGNNPFQPWFQRATLTADMGSGDVTATVKSTVGLPTSGLFKCDSELITYSGVTATTLTGLTRGVNGTTAAAHTHDQSTIQYPLTARPALWITDPTLIAATQRSGNWTFDLIDVATVVEGTSGSAQTFTVPTNATVPFPVGATIEVFQDGAGQITIAAAGGVTLRGAKVKTAAQYSTIGLRKRATNEWVLSGDLA